MKQTLLILALLGLPGLSCWGCAYGGSTVAPDGKNVIILKSGPWGAIRKVMICEYEDEDLEGCKQSGSKP